MLIVLTTENDGVPLTSRKTMVLPSGIQLGPTASNSAPGSTRGVPPSAEITYSCGRFVGSPPEKAICLPSGDQDGRKVFIDPDVNCSFWVPLTRLRHKVPS